uniref:Protein FAR1-RELATED SEQUENCE n=1 Tax=Lactuca sativa TaxID=4236 RepID=A0A9R1XP15_LACSA|nr:hypothetical protein LSAT_V11C400200350 [Lactuca sativa]
MFQRLFLCVRGGVPSPETSTKNTGSRKTNCAFEIFACYYKSNDVWRLKVKHDKHNHEPAMYMEGYIFNHRANDTINALEDLLFVHPTSLEIWRTFPQVLMMDSTYKTNKSILCSPNVIGDMTCISIGITCFFLEIVGVNSTNTTFFIGLRFMDKEKESNYNGALNCLKAIIEKYDSTCMIVTWQRDSIDECIIFTNCGGRYKTDAKWNTLLRDWDTLINLLTLAVYLRNYAKLKSKGTYHPGTKQVPDYLNRVCLDKYKENFVLVWTNQVLNFHKHTNNRVESQHAKLKKFSHTQHGNLDKFFNRIERFVWKCYTPCMENIRQELDRPDAHQIIKDGCGCQLCHRCGLPCAHEIPIHSRGNQAIPLSFIDKIWF